MKLIQFTFLFLFTSNLAFSQTADSLVAFYPFNGNAIEELGSGIDGLVNGAFLTTDRFGHHDSAYYFISDYPSFIDLGDSFDEIFTEPVAKFSFSFWIEPYENMANKVIFGKYGNSNCNENGREFFIRMSPDQKLEFANFAYLNTTTTKHSVLGNTVIYQNTGWYHVVFTYDASIPTSNLLERIKIYLNGVQESTSINWLDGTIETMEDGPSHLGIGIPLDSLGQACGDFAFDGKIDDVKLFDKVLTQAEIDSLFNEPDPILPMLGIAEMGNNIPHIYPNPFVNELNVNNKIAAKISLYDVLGNLIIEEIDIEPYGKLDLSGIKKGVYFLQVADNSGMQTFKLNKIE
ncbi:MAG: T9SS type A sorting domain-containing protein [Bacteroidales bacterium]|nr:T9SS type A sorting domain-containing protein [Bacteroidales bacterium]MCF8454533.1 T9SS type A sorting domain-containing protein [Bacteroidales bacterium]